MIDRRQKRLHRYVTMSSPESPSYPVVEVASEKAGRSFAVLVLLAWGPVIWRLLRNWEHDPQLWHGWLVPLAAGYMGWVRWREIGEERPSSRGGHWAGRLIYAVGLIGVLLAVPVLEANPDWPRVQWLGAGAATVATLGAAWISAGLAACRSMLFPLFFMHTALAWPTMVRAPIMDTLMQTNAMIAAEVVSWLGKPAVVRGNLIEVDAGVIGVDEACSGLRSLQAVWMFAWLFAGVSRLHWGHSLRLLVVALATAGIGNLVRTLFLTWQIGQGGAAAGDKWHDPAGLIALGLTFAVVLPYALYLSGRYGKDTTQRSSSDREIANWSGMRTVIVLAMVAVLGTESATAWWYRTAREGAVHDVRHWRLVTPPPPGWRTAPVSSAVREVLGCSGADQLMTSMPSLSGEGMALVLRWENEPWLLQSEVEAHDPRVCMPAIGGRLVRELTPVNVPIEGEQLRFEGFVFNTQGRTQHVFNAVWSAVESDEDGDKKIRSPGAAIREERWRRVTHRLRSRHFDRLVFVRQNAGDDALAVAWLRERVSELLRR